MALIGSTSSSERSTIRSGVTKANVGLGSVDNESKSTMFTSPTFTGNPISHNGGVHAGGSQRHMGTGPFFPGYEGDSSKLFHLGNNNNQSNTSSANNMTMCYIYRTGHWGNYPYARFYCSNRYYMGGTGCTHFAQGGFTNEVTNPSQTNNWNLKSQSSNPGGAHSGQTVTRYEIGLSAGTYTNLFGWIEISFPLTVRIWYNNISLSQADTNSASGAGIYFNNFGTP